MRNRPVPNLICRVTSAPPKNESVHGPSPRTQILLAACACAGASAFLYAVDPSRHAIYPQCLFYRMTGLYCAGCGATRALYALLHGRFLEALHDNALFLAALPFLLFVSGLYLLEAWQKNVWPAWHAEPRSLIRTGLGIFLLLLLFTVVRNLPGWPFDLLKPLA